MDQSNRGNGLKADGSHTFEHAPRDTVYIRAKRGDAPHHFTVGVFRSSRFFNEQKRISSLEIFQCGLCSCRTKLVAHGFYVVTCSIQVSNFAEPGGGFQPPLPGNRPHVVCAVWLVALQRAYIAVRLRCSWDPNCTTLGGSLGSRPDIFAQFVCAVQNMLWALLGAARCKG